jgi:hypothetical protein
LTRLVTLHVPNTTTKDIIMKYTVALSVAAKAATCLQDDEGSMSDEEAAFLVSTLFLALRAIAKHNSVELPPRP